jgi:phosphoglycerol transferase MdoB-like AlkP superfamily enzyme
MTHDRLAPRWVAHRHGGVVLFLILFLLLSSLVRLGLLVRSAGSVDWNPSLLAVFGWGLVFDLGAGLLMALPGALLLTLLPARFFEHQLGRAAAHLALVAALAVLLFAAVAEWTFWDEFSVRFNFIAVDYLVYTTEVLANIRESYPMPLIFTGIALVAAGGYGVLLRTGWVAAWLRNANEPWQRRYAVGAAWGLAATVAACGFDQQRLLSAPNVYHRELAKNGIWSLFAAFRNNELEYRDFYPTLPDDEAFAELRRELTSDGETWLGAPRDTLRFISHSGEELHPNVIQITVESLSADFLSIFNPESRLTPNLDALAAHSLVFTNLYATGTRTDRGMEALTLALPPTPGRSLIKRPRNANLFTLGSVFRTRGYDTAFLYGGYGYFDNMNAFFGGNGYRVIDRAAVAANDITFANAWGACDEDLLRWTLREADEVHAAGKPFHFFVMTTSNHRPYTYPEGRIDLPSKVSGRAGAVKYTDFAIGEFLRAAQGKPWFNNTVFVIVADHCASVAGKTELPVHNYHIPLFIYAPGGQVKPGQVTELMSQVDYAPTLLALLNWSYASRFFGWDVVHHRGDRRALIGNYQKLGLYEPGLLGVLAPRRDYRQYAYDATSTTLREDPSLPDTRAEAISYYQAASYLYQTDGYRALTTEEQRATAGSLTASSPRPAGL